MDDKAAARKIQELTERYTAKELAAAYLKASRRAIEAEAKASEQQKRAIKYQAQAMAGQTGRHVLGLGL